MAIGTAAAIIGSAVIGGIASSEAADAQADAAAQSAATQRGISNQQMALQREQFDRQVALQEPWRTAGVNALTKMQGGEFAQPDAFKFGAEDYTADPGYAFRLSEGQKALERQAAARGGLISGSALKAATRYGQDMGSQEFQNAYQRALTGYNTEVARSDTGYNRLAALAGVGQTSTDKIGAAGQNMTAGMTGALSNYGNTASEAIGAGAQARASGYMGLANAASGGLGQYLNYQQNQSNNALLQQVLNRNMDPRGGYSGQGPFGYAP
ncbi:hypothetical protein K0U83_03070 [bacterium]|nr:hypothetical protein [bacterium]